MSTIFDTVIDRENTGSTKWDQRGEQFGKADVLPMWVADMDFPSPAEVTSAIIERAKHPVYGYTEVSSSFDQSVVSWLKYRFRWEVSPDWITHSPGVVTSIITAILAYTHPGD
ncbi:MAG TPA: cystathionine beta-lyase, partial [Bacillota bacterium]|nr:cystathionine beta-lyase [Bacillota bacterium]